MLEAPLATPLWGEQGLHSQLLVTNPEDSLFLLHAATSSLLWRKAANLSSPLGHLCMASQQGKVSVMDQM